MKANSERDRRKMTVSRVAKVCALAFCLITLVALVIAFSDVVYAVDGWYMKNARPAMAYKAIMSTYRLVIFAILFSFFVVCGRRESVPFGRAQTALLVVDGFLIAAYGLVGEFGADWVNHLPKLMYYVDPVSTMYSYPGGWLLYVGFGIFLVCLAVMFHYANDLYEDSDSII